jgi:hypothetical protein
VVLRVTDSEKEVLAFLITEVEARVTVAGFVEVCAVDIASMVVEEMLRQLQAELMRLLGMADKVRQAGAGADVAARLRTGVKVVDEYIVDVDVIVDVRVETLVVEETIV